MNPFLHSLVQLQDLFSFSLGASNGNRLHEGSMTVGATKYQPNTRTRCTIKQKITNTHTPTGLARGHEHKGTAPYAGSCKIIRSAVGTGVYRATGVAARCTIAQANEQR